MSGNLASILSDSAAKFGDRLAVKLDDVEFNYELLDQAAARVAAMLKAKGMEPGDRVGIMLPNVPYFPVAYYGVLRAGGVVVPMNVLLKAREVGFYQGPGREDRLRLARLPRRRADRCRRGRR
jgi:long-chain acyl-CoA synthetase